VANKDNSLKKLVVKEYRYKNGRWAEGFTYTVPKIFLSKTHIESFKNSIMKEGENQ
jgi:hypothetical protein